MKTLENEEKKQQQKENRPTPPPGQTFSHQLSASSLASIAPASLRREDPFGTPGFDSGDNVDTPPNVSGDEKLSKSKMTPSTGMSFAPTLANPHDTTARRLFDGDGDDGDDDGDDDGVVTPVSSPMKSPPRVLSKSQSSN